MLRGARILDDRRAALIFDRLQSGGPVVQPEPSRVLELEAQADRGDVEGIERVATPSSFLCPDCGGGLWDVRGGRPERLRCRVGHGYSLEDLVASQDARSACSEAPVDPGCGFARRRGPVTHALGVARAGGSIA